jgi:hypothetical protein
MRILFVLIIFLTLKATGQDAVPFKQILDSANVLVKQFYGQYNFTKYIKFDPNKGKLLGDSVRQIVGFNDEPDFTIKKYEFHYYLTHKIFGKDTARISFILERHGQLLLDEHNEGLFHHYNLDTLTSISKSKAIAIAKQNNLPAGKEKWKVELRWYEIDPMTLKLNDDWEYTDFIKGYFTWAVQSTLETFQIGCFRYSKKVAYIDILTGKLIEIKNE